MGKDETLPDYEYSKVPTKQIIAEKQEIPTHYGYGVRHVQLLICFLCILVSFIARGHMGVTIVAMSDTPAGNKSSANNITIQTDVGNVTNVQEDVEINATIEDIDNLTDRYKKNEEETNGTTAEYHHKKYIWPKSTQEMVLGSFFLGYCIMTFPMGMVVQRWGGKIPLQIALFVNGVASVLAPWVINWGGWKAVCACRVLQGLSQAGVYPSIQNLLSNWVPVNERGTLTSYVYTGSTLGTVIAFQMAGYLAESRWGWPSTFWVVGAICMALFAVLTIFGAASPPKHKSISEEEKTYIMGRVDDGTVKKLSIPWKAILTSRHVWGVLATHVGSGVSFVFFFTQVPSYIHYILKIDVRSSGILSSLPYVVSFFTSLSFGVLSDYLTNNKYIEVKNGRRLFNSISQVGVAVALVCVTFTTSTVVAVLCLVASMGCHMAMHVGWMVNHMDLAPNFSGTLMTLGNTGMNIFNVLLPILISYVVTDVHNQTQWRIIFFTIASAGFVANAIFVLTTSADTQPWNDSEQTDAYLEEAESKRENQKIAKT
uniref:SFRICE_018480 n=1 Tax=Spodoptera frugiperda TaxID=7108 RepID=A0A2H1X2V7_SPOFR